MATHRDRERRLEWPAAGRSRDESGNILVIFALLLPMFLMCCAVVIDVGWWWANGKRAQIAADACALAAASRLPTTYNDTECVITGTTATPTNPDYALENLPQKGLADEPRHLGTSVISPYLPEAATNPADSYVEAKVTIAVRTFFGRIINKDFIRITRRAVAESAPGDMAIFAKDTTCGSEGVWLNNGPMNIQGEIWSNGDFKANGKIIIADSAQVGGPNNCAPSPPTSPSCTGCSFGGSPNPSIQNTDAPWPVWFEESTYFGSCKNPITDTLKLDSSSPYVSGATLQDGIYCATKELIVDVDGLSGKATFITPKLALKKGHNFTAFVDNLVVFGTGKEELILNTDGSTFTGILFHPGDSPESGPCPPKPDGRITFNGKNNKVIGMIAACTVRVDGEGFNHIGKFGKRALALYE